jgi:hypothetical protein
MSDNESDGDGEYSERINEMYERERDALKAYLDMMDNTEKDSSPDEIEETRTQTYAHYPGVDALKDDLEFATNNYENGNIHICAYHINKEGKDPFLQYILRKYDETHETKKDLVTFPSFFYERGLPIMDYANLILEIIRTSYRIKTGNYEYKGFINNGNQFYVFYDFSECVIRCHDLRRMNDLWLVTMDEILNHKKVCNFPIDKKVTEFFSDLNNMHFTYLKDRCNNIYEAPIVGYVGLEEKKIDFTSCFGEPQSLQVELPDPYYYFTDYQKAFKVGGFKKSVEDGSIQNNVFDLKSNRSGLVRFALFTGYVKMFSEKNKENEHDHLYNSIYLSDDNGHPTWALKKYEQQCPLTCHYINKPVLGEEWNSNKDYFII